MENNNRQAEEAWEEPTEGTINEWKEKWGEDNVSRITVEHPVTEKRYNAYFRSPRLKDLDVALKDGTTKSSNVAMLKRLFLDCKLEVHPEILKQDVLLSGVYTKLGELTATAEATIKKL